MTLWREPNTKGKDKAPWVLRLPSVFQINSSLIFIAIMVMIVGLSALLGVSDPQSITSKMPLPFYKIWGGIMASTGFFLALGIVRRDELIEKLTARILSMSIAGFAAWAIAANGVPRSIVTLSLCSVVIFLLEQRISLINVLLYARKIAHKHDKKPGGEHGA